MNFLWPAIFSLFLTILLLPLNIRFAKKYGLIDDPNTRQHPAHIQNRTVPRAGGLAPFLAITTTILIFIPIQKHFIGIILALFILLSVGLADDRLKNLSPYFRLLMQFLAAVLIVSSGVGISFITNPLGGIIYLNDIVADLVAIFWMVWVMNMINWSKGVDGQMPGIVAISAFILGVLSLKLYFAGDPNQGNIAKLCLITASSAVGLLIFNWHPAKIFPGFSGSNIFGLLLATLAILSGAKLATAGLLLLIPATDFIYTVFRRILSGKSPVWGDRGHLHHKLLDLGLSHQQITLFYMLGSAMLGTVALTLTSQGKLFAAVLVTAALLGVILWLNFFGGLSKPEDPGNG